MNYELPKGWNYLLDDNVIIVTGVGKSGMSWASNLVATFKPTYHLYNAVSVKTIPPDIPQDSLDSLREMIKLNVLHDYCVPRIRGIYLCDDPNHVVYSDWYWASCPEQRLERRQSEIFSSDALVRIIREKPFFVFDLCDALPKKETIRKIFKGCKFIHLVRNGLHVVTHRTNLNLDQIKSYHNPPTPFVDWMINGIAPWYIEAEALENWQTYSIATRAAHIWRVQVDMHKPDIFYENMMQQPIMAARNILFRFPILQATKQTEIICERIMTYKEEKTDFIKLSQIQEPERSKFKKSMQRLGYL
jgi:hypothetical protein